MKYFNTDDPPTGEICIRGLCVFNGYYKDPERTKEVIDEDGWFYTGDIGKWNKNGTLSIIDRIKNIFKLSQGEYIAVEKLETIMGTSKYVARLWIYGDSFKDALVAVVVVNPESVTTWARENGIPGDIKTLVKDKRVNEMILKDLEKVAKEEQLQGFEFVKVIHLISEEFESIGATTPTLKLKRSILLQHFKKEIEEMYDKLENEVKPKAPSMSKL